MSSNSRPSNVRPWVIPIGLVAAASLLYLVNPLAPPEGTIRLVTMTALVATCLMLLGFAFVLAPLLPALGRLPGDITIEREGLRLLVPAGTIVVLSILASVILALLSRS